MAKYRYPGIDLHIKEHEYFKNSVNAFKDVSYESEMEKLAGLKDFVQDWIASHIQGTDREYAPFFIEKGLNSPGKK